MADFKAYLIRKSAELPESLRFSDPAVMRSHRPLSRHNGIYDYAELTDEGVRRVKKLGNVFSVEPEGIAGIPREVEPDRIVRSRSQLTGPDALSYLNVPELHRRGIKGKGVTVAILDSGLDSEWAAYLKHKGLLAGAKSFVGEDPLDAQNFHGSHVAGIVHRVAPDAKILVVQVLSSNGSGPYSALMAGSEWAAEQGAVVLNASLGGPKSDQVNRFVDDLVNKHALFFSVAAGNDGQRGNPADEQSPSSAKRPLSVANTDYRTGRIADSSSAGMAVDVAAPGYQINSWHLDGKWGLATGTSMAAPFIAGIGALIISEKFKGYQGRRSVVQTARDTSLRQISEGRGVADAAAAVAFAQREWPSGPKPPKPEKPAEEKPAERPKNPSTPLNPAPKPEYPEWVRRLLRLFLGRSEL